MALLKISKIFYGARLKRSFKIFMPILQVQNLTKKFKKHTAVCDVSFTIAKGEILGLLGPNGAGKSTTIEMILGLIKPTEGQIKIFGLDIETDREEILNRINYSSAYIQFMSRLTVKENLRFFGKLYNVKKLDQKIAELSARLEITDLLSTLFFKLSSGQRTRVILTKTLLNEPEFLLLDEPTSSLDPDIAYKVREMLKKIHQERQITILYTSHNMAEVEEMCDRVIFLQQGRIVAAGAPNQLKKEIRDYYLELSFNSEQESKLTAFLQSKKWTYEIKSPGHLRVKTSADDLAAMLQLISRQNFDIYDIDVNKPDLEEVFLKIAKG